MTYSDFIEELKNHAEPSFAAFQKRLIFTKYEILGVRTPTMRALAKKYKEYLKEIFSFPNEYYEVVFIKLTIVSLLPYEEFVRYVDDCVLLMDNWALCDSFKANCIKKEKGRFFEKVKELFQKGNEYQQRYALVTCLYYYIEEEYFLSIEKFIREANIKLYYVHMAVAWLLVEILTKNYEYGVQLLKSELVDEATCHKAIRKGIESYRLTKEQKEFLRSLK